jgi:hypothetical protein
MYTNISIQLLSQEECISITKTYLPVLFSEIAAAYFKNHREGTSTSTLCGKKAKCYNAREVGTYN